MRCCWMRLLQAKQQIRVDNDEDRLVSQVAREYTRLMVLNLTNNINKFKYVIVSCRFGVGLEASLSSSLYHTS